MTSPMARKHEPGAFASLLLGAVCALALTVTPTASASAQPAQTPGRLFAQTGTHGSLTPVKHGGKRRYTLTLRGVTPQLVWFQDRPARHAGHMSTRAFMRSWAKYGFRADPPNAALTLLGGKDEADTVVVELTRPRYGPKQRTLRHSARPLSRATGGLADFETDGDRRVPRHFAAASLFIDDAGVVIVNGCTIAQYGHTECPNA